MDQYDITEVKLKRFIEKEWYGFIQNFSDSIQIQALVLDKRFYKINRNNFTPLHILTQVLFDRVELHPHKKCTIVFDQMDSEIKSTVHTQGQILKISSKEIDLGSFHKKFSHLKPRFEKSKNSNFLQLADTVAYNIYRQFVGFGDFKDNLNTENIYPYLNKIIDNFYSKNGKIEGYGIVRVPKATKNPLK